MARLRAIQGAAISVGSEPRETLRRVLRGRYAALAAMTASALVSGVAEALFLVVVTRAAFAITEDDARVGIVGGWYLSVAMTLALALGLLAVRLALAVLNSWQSARLTTAVVADARLTMSDAFLRASWPVQQALAAGGLQQVLAHYSYSAGALVGGVGQSLITGANLLAMIVLAVAVDPLGAAVLVLSVGVLSVVLRPLRAVVRRRSRYATESGMKFATAVGEVSQLGQELHVFRVQEQAQAVIADLVDENRRRDTNLGFASSLTAPAYTGLAYVALLAALALVAGSDLTSLTDLGAVMLIMLRSLGYGQALQNSYVRVLQGLPPMEDYFEGLAQFESGRRREGGDAIGPIGVLSAEDVSFDYEPGAPVLKRISFSIEPHEIIGIVGPSGGGKSTLVQVLLGLREPTTGTIRAEGRDIRTLSQDEWARKVTFVPQEAHLMTGTVADNIRFLRPGPSDDDIVRAARLAHLHDEIMQMPGGYTRRLGADGGRLSGGQQQRLCLARALVERPEVLILDEPTSSLDVKSEHLITRTLVDLRERTTIIVIAHRLSTLDICDRIMVIQDGELVDFDTPARLEQSSVFFQEALILSGLR